MAAAGAGRTRGAARAAVLGALVTLVGCAAPAPAAGPAQGASLASFPSLEFPVPTADAFFTEAPVAPPRADAGPASSAADWTGTPDRAAPDGGWDTTLGAQPPQVHTGTRDDDEHGPRYAAILLGGREFKDDDWKPFESQPVGGFVFDERHPETGHGIEVSITFSEDDGFTDDKAFGTGTADVEIETFELAIGWRRTFFHDEQGLHPYVSAGGVVVRSTYDVSNGGFDESEEDYAPGGYVGGGLLWDIDEVSRLGLDYRYVLVDDLEFNDATLDTSYSQLVLTYGWAF